jgi:hypothetical protein
MSKSILDKNLKHALTIYAEARTSMLLQGFDPIVQTSVQDYKETAVDSRHAHKSSHHNMRRIFSATVAILILSLLFTVCVNADVRNGVLERLRKVFSDDVSYELWREDDKTDYQGLPDIEIEVPDGFVLDREWGNPFGKHKNYTNEETLDSIGLDYTLLDNSGEVGFSFVDEIRHIEIHGMNADLYPHSDRSSQCNIIWVDEALNVCIVITTTLDEDSAIWMAESVYK